MVGPGRGLVRLRNAEASADSTAFLEEMLATLAEELQRPGLAGLGTVQLAEVVPGAVRPLYAATAQQLGLLPSAQVWPWATLAFWEKMTAMTVTLACKSLRNDSQWQSITV